MALRVLRVMRVFRLLRVLQASHASGLRELIKTLALSAPSLANVASVLALVVFIYAVLGVQLFCFVRDGDVLQPYVNFASFGSACLLLFQACRARHFNPTISARSAASRHLGSRHRAPPLATSLLPPWWFSHMHVHALPCRC